MTQPSVDDHGREPKRAGAPDADGAAAGSPRPDPAAPGATVRARVAPPPGCRQVFLVRHAESERVGTPVAMDPALTPRGQAQLAALAARVAELAVDAVVCSELARAARTAEVIAAPRGLAPEVDPGWNELHTVGDWRALPAATVEELVRTPLFLPDDERPHGETLRALHRRALAAWDRLLARPGRALAVVSHNNLLGALIGALLGADEGTPRRGMLWYPHTAITELWVFERDYDPALPGRLALAYRIADASHLPADLVTR